MFSSPDYPGKFREHFPYKRTNINLSKEKEKDDCLSFLDVNIFREIEKFITNVNRKNAVSGVYTNFKSFIFETYKIDLIKRVLLRRFSLCSDLQQTNRPKTISPIYVKPPPAFFNKYTVLSYKKNMYHC